MLSGIPPSGPWTCYYLYGREEIRHRMNLHLAFTADGRIEGEGIDDIARFIIDGSFDPITSAANWTKAYVVKHCVKYSGLYSGKTICGDWTLGIAAGGFWIWPSSIGQGDSAQQENEVDFGLELTAAVPEPAGHR